MNMEFSLVRLMFESKKRLYEKLAKKDSSCHF